MFGFSRGALTVCTLLGLIHNQGLIPIEIVGETVSHAEMHRNSNAAWRAYRGQPTFWTKTFVTIKIARATRDL